jgi:hypothetical protein
VRAATRTFCFALQCGHSMVITTKGDSLAMRFRRFSPLRRGGILLGHLPQFPAWAHLSEVGIPNSVVGD